ncbi:MAG: efflux RND transporter periplasmic adaptor subunit [Candidatus Eisenbacteria bacterium]
MHGSRGKERTDRREKREALLFGVLLLVAVFAVSCGGDRELPDGHAHDQTEASVWTCSMHPQVRSDGPGDCPICGMDLIPVEDDGRAEEAGERVLSVSEAGRKLMDIETAPVMRMSVEVDVGLVGKVTYDEGRVSRIAAWVPGRVERLHVDYVGYEVRAGEPMVELYGPELLAAQQELLQSIGAHRDAVAAGKPRLIESTRQVLEAVRERLRLWGLSEAQVTEIESRGVAAPRVTIESPAGGTVVEKSVTEGSYVSTGQMLFTIADLSVVWVELSAYESDLPWLSEGQPVEFETTAFPGRTFAGKLSFVEPVVDPVTRTVTVRAEVPNGDRALMPDMFVRATARSAHHAHGEKVPLVIPATAPLLTGERAVVYVELSGADAPTFEGREVVLGPRAGDYYIVVSGLHEGERVVSEGAFKIDSALQIRAKPSMMSPEADAKPAPVTGHAGH